MSRDPSSAVSVAIRPILQGEVALAERLLPLEEASPGRYYDYFAMQQRNEAICLIAWQEGLPVGHALLCWQGSRHEPMASQLRDCPHFSAVIVAPERRSRGIGTRLLEHGEALARLRGYRQVGLNVILDNVRARALYERLGYREAGFGTYTLRHRYVDAQGQAHIHEAACIYLIKAISS